MKKILVLLFTVIISNLLFSQIRKGPYLIYPGNNTQMKILCQFNGTEYCLIKWGKTTTCNDGFTYTVENSASVNEHLHKYLISGLTPNTKYYYEIIENNGVGTSYSGSFRTAQLNGSSDFSFYAYGDTRTHPENQNIVCAEILNRINSDPSSQTFLLHAGDWVNNGNSEDDWDTEFFEKSFHDNIEVQSKIPIMGVRGNHEGNANLFNKYLQYNYVSPGSSYYSFDYGSVHVSVLDQYSGDLGLGQSQYNWLENDLSNSQKKWKIILIHAPGYTDGGHKNDTEQTLIQDIIQPLCLTHGVKLIIGGHNHYYARCVKAGVHHLTLGGGGAPLYDPEYGDDGNNIYWIHSDKTLHFVKFQVKGIELTANVIRPNGTIVETFTICEDYDMTDYSFSNTSSLHLGGRDGTYYASENITATDVTIGSGTDVSFVAGKKIVLKTGFSVNKSATFQALISECQSNDIKNAKLKSISNFSDSLNDKEDIRLFPNPFSNTITINCDSEADNILCMEIYDMQGRIIFSRDNIFTNTLTIDCANFIKGIYLVKVISNQTIFYRKVQKL